VAETLLRQQSNCDSSDSQRRRSVTCKTNGKSHEQSPAKRNNTTVQLISEYSIYYLQNIAYIIYRCMMNLQFCTQHTVVINCRSTEHLDFTNTVTFLFGTPSSMSVCPQVCLKTVCLYFTKSTHLAVAYGHDLAFLCDVMYFQFCG